MTNVALRSSISRALDKAGVDLGDTLLVHADATQLVKASLNANWSIALGILTDALSQQIGPNGTLLVPTFNWDFCAGKPYCDKLTPSKQGVFANYIRRLDKSERSANPIFSFSGFGHGIQDIFSDIGKSSLGPNSVFDRLHQLNAKLIFFNTSFYNCTFVHHVEHMLQVPYRYSKKFTGLVTFRGNTFMDEYEFYVRDEKLNVVSYPTRLGEKLMKMELMKSSQCVGGQVLAVKAQDVYKVAVASLDEDAYYLLKHDPNNLNEREK